MQYATSFNALHLILAQMGVTTPGHTLPFQSLSLLLLSMTGTTVR